MTGRSLTLGQFLDHIPAILDAYELKNDITRETPASFEPSIDYVVTKNPPFAFEVLAHDHHSASRDSGTDNRAH